MFKKTSLGMERPVTRAEIGSKEAVPGRDGQVVSRRRLLGLATVVFGGGMGLGVPLESAGAQNQPPANVTESAVQQTEHLIEASTPVISDDEGDKLEEGRALCLSGGGYRAMLFHAGSLLRLNEAGYLPTLARISCVSGGAITGGVLGFKWRRLDFATSGAAANFREEVIAPLRALAGETIDVSSVMWGVFTPGAIAEKVAGYYRRYLFGDATLQDLPADPPRIVLNATNVQSGALWRFMRPYMGDYKVGLIRNPELSLATAVAASSAFPPILSPLPLNLDPALFVPGTETLHHPPYTTKVLLTDGGVYDNLGLEPIWKRYRTIFVSDGGGQMQPEESPAHNWISHSIRVNSLIDNQVRSLRKRQVVGSLKADVRHGAYWGIRTDPTEYGAAVALPCPHDKTMTLANVPTRLKSMDSVTQQRLMNWGYAVTDAALRRYYEAALPRPKDFPFEGGVG
jgi:NTE family protein